MEYINNADKEQGCLFCTVASSPPELAREKLLLYKTDLGLIMLNKFPYNSGHIMVSPTFHIGNLLDLPEEYTIEMIRLAKLGIKALEATMSPQGYNMGFNIGRAAGAGIEEHIHMHIVPRWNGDTNFMPIVGETKVIPQHLEKTYNILRKAILEFVKEKT